MVTDVPLENPPAEPPACEHYWAYLCYGGLSVRQCQLCHGIDWEAQKRDAEEIREQERQRIRSGLPDAMERCRSDLAVTGSGLYPVRLEQLAGRIDELITEGEKP